MTKKKTVPAKWTDKKIKAALKASGEAVKPAKPGTLARLLEIVKKTKADA
jgi:hypothetical protein